LISPIKKDYLPQAGFSNPKQEFSSIEGTE